MHFDRIGSLRVALLASAIAMGFAGNASTTSYDYRLVHRFSAQSDGNSAVDGMAFDAAGNLYGATRGGGDRRKGTIYRIAKDGTESVIHSFSGGADGEQPLGGVLIDKATGDLYGTTGFGGRSRNCCGVLFKLATDGAFTVLHQFKSATDGNEPVGRLIRDGRGNIYGVTALGGAHTRGTIYRYDPRGRFTVLHHFEGSVGFNMGKGGILGDKAGNLYGTNNGITPADLGTIYKLAPDRTYTTLYSFTGGSDGEYPNVGLTRDEAGNLYGTTTSTVFKLAPDGSLTTLHTFTGGTDGATPNGYPLLIGGYLYGTTYTGGDLECGNGFYIGCGVAFKVATDGSGFAVMHMFGQDDPYPTSGFSAGQGRLFGTTDSDTYGHTPTPPGSVYSIGVKRR